MADLLQSQIRDSCKLALPEGLKELMSDISREVLRSQPENLYQFISNYLEALLDAREALSIACRLCSEICNCSCQSELDYELSCIGLNRDDEAKVKDIILDHFDKSQVQESSLLIDLATKTSVTDTQLRELQNAVTRAFQRSVLKHKDLQVSFANHPKCIESSNSSRELLKEAEQDALSTSHSSSDFYKPCYSDASSSSKEMQTEHLYRSSSYRIQHPLSVSATTLAGSYVQLPDKIPYSAHSSVIVDSAYKTPMLSTAEDSVLHMLGSYIFTDHVRQREHTNVSVGYDKRGQEMTDSVELRSETIKRIISHDSYEYETVRSRHSKESRRDFRITAIEEKLNESNSSDFS